MRSRLRTIGLKAVGIGLALSLGSLPAQAQSEQQAGALVEALRQAASKGSNPGLYSEWQVKGNNIPRWSRFCFGRGREITPEQFEADRALAREMLTCIIRDALKEETPLAGNDELLAVRRVAAWWMTGDANRHGSANLAPYLQKVVSFYQAQQNQAAAPSEKPPSEKPSATVASPAAPPRPTNVPPAAPPVATAPSTPGQPSLYDRYMKAGYAATDQKQYETALRYFRRALDERPNDSYSTQAIRNIEGTLQPDRLQPPSPQTSTPGTPAPRPMPPAPSSPTLQAAR